MKVTKELIESIIREQIKEAQDLASKAAPTAKSIMALPAAKAVFEKLKAVLDSQGKPGAPGRKEEIDLVLRALGITVADLNMIASPLRSQESAKKAAATAPGAEKSV